LQCNRTLNRGNDGESAFLETSLQSALQHLTNYSDKPIYRRFVIGGTSIFKEALSLDKSGKTDYVDRILLTRISSPAFDDCDVFMPDFVAQDKAWRKMTHKELEDWAGFGVAEGNQVENGVEYEFEMWER
jgi:dihydrofolate reductase